MWIIDSISTAQTFYLSFRILPIDNILSKYSKRTYSLFWKLRIQTFPYTLRADGIYFFNLTISPRPSRNQLIKWKAEEVGSCFYRFEVPKHTAAVPLPTMGRKLCKSVCFPLKTRGFLTCWKRSSIGKESSPLRQGVWQSRLFDFGCQECQDNSWSSPYRFRLEEE